MSAEQQQTFHYCQRMVESTTSCGATLISHLITSRLEGLGVGGTETLFAFATFARLFVAVIVAVKWENSTLCEFHT